MSIHIELPGLLAEIEAVAGRKAALAIARTHGGLSKEFPAPRLLESNGERYANHWLVLTVGATAALEIVNEIFPAGGRAEIPSARVALRKQYIADNAALLSVAEMATVLEMTERGVRRIKASLRQKGTIQ